jgi:hypothetical protein
VISTGRTSTYTTVVNITNEFLQAVENDADWRLIDPKTKEAVKDSKR